MKLLFLKIRNPSDDSLEILLKTIDLTINSKQFKEYISICKGKFSDFRYNYKNTILKKAQYFVGIFLKFIIIMLFYF